MHGLLSQRTALSNAFAVDFIAEFGELFAALEGGIGVRVMPSEAGCRVAVWDGRGCLPVADRVGPVTDVVVLVRKALAEVADR